MHYFSSFFRPSFTRPRIPLDRQLIGPRLLLRIGDPDYWKAWRMVREISRSFLVPWEPAWPDNATSYNFYCSVLRRQWREWRQGTSFAFTIFRHDMETAPVLVGGITLAEVQYTGLSKGTIGYWIGQPYAGLGLMSEAADLVCSFAFNDLRLQRVEASCLPHNEPSKSLLRKLNFIETGYAKDYLQINGKREDHLLWTKENFS